MDILEAIRARRARSLQRSITFSEANEKAVKQNAESVKKLLSNEEPLVGSPGSELNNLYYKMRNEYTSGTLIRAAHTVNNRSKSLWARVKDAQLQSEVDPETFVRAQFHFFHKHFGKIPEPYQLATENAITRARNYAALPHKSTRRIIAHAVEHKVDFAELMRASEQRMQQMMRSQSCSREEIYKKFVLTGLTSFPKEYLSADPVYRGLTGE